MSQGADRVLDEMRYRMLIEREPEERKGLDKETLRLDMVQSMLEEDMDAVRDDGYEWISDALIDGVRGFNEWSDLEVAAEYWDRYCTDDYLFDREYDPRVHEFIIKPIHEWRPNPEWDEDNSVVHALRMYALVEQTRLQEAIDSWIASMEYGIRL